MKRALLILLAAVMVFSLAGCSQPAVADVLKSDKPRITPIAVPAPDMHKLVEGNSQFAFDLYRYLKTDESNLFYSPYSISMALAMTFGGARGETAQQMADTLRFLLAQEQLHQAFNRLDQDLADRGQDAQGMDGEAFRLNIVNAIWGQVDYQFKSDYLDLLAQNYGAGLRIVDYIKAAEKARITINDWVSDQTEQKIQDLLPPNSINELTRLVLTNAIYFNAAWLHPFDESFTTNGVFHLLNGKTVSVPMMKMQKRLNYAEGQGYQAVELLYDGLEFSMIIVLPDQLQEFEANLHKQKIDNLLQNMQFREVRLSMPKFEVESEFSLKKALSAMGMPVAFTEHADFSGIDGTQELLISDVVHKAFVKVDEAGTEAAAATGVIVGVTSIPVDIIDLNIDSPFIFLIRDIQTDTILFMGRILNPAE